MAHQGKLGKCDRCKQEIASPFGAKDHVIGDIVRSDVSKWRKDNDEVRVA